MHQIRREDVQSVLSRGALLVEVLPRDEYEEEHIACAVNIPLKELRRDRVADLPRGRPVIVYCHDAL